MKDKLLSLAAVIVAASIFFACSSSGINTSDAVSLINGPNSVKGTISGTMLDNTAYSFPYDYHYTTNDGNSSSESWIENSTGDTVIYVWQYFYFDRNGYDDYGDKWSPSGKYMYLEFALKRSTVKNVTTLTLEPLDQDNRYFEGMWQNITTAGNRFVYGSLYYRSYQSYTVPPTFDLTNLAYDKNSQILSGKLSFVMGANNDVQVNSGNHNATTITGDFRIYVSKENFDLVKGSDYYGQVYRKRGK